MNRRGIFIVLVMIAGLLLAGVTVVKRYTGAQARRDAALRQYESALDNARQVLVLRAKEQRIALHQKPPKDVIALVNSVLAESGLERERFKALTPQSDGPVGNNAGGAQSEMYRRQTLSLSLQSMTAAGLGRFLETWRSNQAIWTPTQIELTHRRGRQADSNQYDVTIVLSALYVAS